MKRNLRAGTAFAAVLATFAFVAAVVAWAANYFSTIHRVAAS